MILYRGERYRLYPTPEQVTRIEQWEHSLRFLWNLAHGQRMAMGRRCKVDRRRITAFDQINELTELRAMLPWLADVPRDVCAQLLVELDAAWQQYFKRTVAIPKFKSKSASSRASMVAPQAFRVEGFGRSGFVVFPKLGRVPAVVHRPVVGRALSCSIVRDGDQWFACISCEREIVEPLPSCLPPVALDMGIARLITDSSGGVVENPRHAAKIQPRLARAQRTVSRRTNGSKNQRKAYAKVTRIYQKSRRQKEHNLHVVSAMYAKNHGVLIVENLDVMRMSKSAKGTVSSPGRHVAQKRGINREIRSAGWSRFFGMLKYKVVPEGGRVLEVPAAYSSQTCSVCGCVDAAARRAQARFACTACGHTDNADVNAAKVLLARGLAKIAVEATVTVCGGMPAREAPVKQKLRVVRRGTRPVAAEQSTSVSTG